ncbi:glycosyltransferase family 4 protein [Patescibacteria group bacterium]|nr:glycosyltransferase family 4 protein [Patescibacteria group bacterium]
MEIQSTIHKIFMGQADGSSQPMIPTTTNNGKNNGRKPHIAVMHFSGPPTISGVDVIIRDHARLFRHYNYKVDLLVGSGKQFRKDIPVHVFRQISASNPHVLKVRQELEKGIVSKRFYQLEKSLYRKIKRYFLANDIRVVIVHNIMTRHYNLALTSVIVKLMRDLPDVKFIAWIHDTAFFDDPNFHLDKTLTANFPWNLLVTSHKEMTYVCVSEFLKQNLIRAFRPVPSEILMIPNGLDIPKFLGLSPVMRQFYDYIDGLNSDLIGIIPVRAVPRKKIEYGIQIARCMVEKGINFKLILTANIDRKRAENIAYFDKLQKLVVDFHLEKHVFFLEQFFRENVSEKPDARIPMPEAYLMSDFLLLTSSIEGFGLPLLEAGLIRAPIFASDIPPFREVGTTNINYFSLENDPKRVADYILSTMKKLPQAYFYRKVVNQYSLRMIVKKQVLPLLHP